MDTRICEAIQEQKFLQIYYEDGYRIVEPHAYGENTKGHELLRAYQVQGSSESGEYRGWKLFRIDEMHSIHVLNDNFDGPRQGYRRDDSALNLTIYCQL